MRQDEVTRRSFVAGTAGAAFGAMVVPRHVLGGAGYLAPSETVNVAIVGCGGQGASDATEIMEGGQNIVALADVDFGFVDSTMAGRARGRNGQPNKSAVKLQEAYGKAKRYADYRKMLEEQKDIDGVVIATPDHTHAVIAKAAMELGKHVYVEKPLTWSVHEARVLRETAQRTKAVTQMGNQGHSSEGAALINEWIRAGVIGPVREVHVWTNRPIWPQGIPRPESPLRTRPGHAGGRRRLRQPVEFATAERDDRDGHQRRRDSTAGSPVGPLSRPGPRSAVPPDLSSVQLARLVGLGDRRAGRYGSALDRPPLLGAGAEIPVEHRGNLDALGDGQQESTGELPTGDAGRVPLPGAARSHR